MSPNATSGRLEGQPIAPADALAVGVIHAFVPAERLIETARQWVLGGGKAEAPWDQKGFKLPGGGPHAPAGYLAFGPEIAARRGKTGASQSATANILKTLYEGAQVPIDAALRIENRYFFNTTRSAEVQSKVAAFLERKS